VEREPDADLHVRGSTRPTVCTGRTISAAVSTRFAVTAAYVGKMLRISVTATNGLGSATAYSAAVGRLP
jgi:hypothetical protein